ACLHFTTYVAVDQSFHLHSILDDIVKRKFIYVGFTAFLLLIPLAATSTNGMVRRLGAVRWQRLHRLVYVAATLGVIHFIWRVKKDITQPVAYGMVLAVLLGFRGVVALQSRGRRRGAAGAQGLKRAGEGDGVQ